MKIRVKLFAGLRQSAGWAEGERELSDGATVAALLAQLAAEEPALGLAARPVYAAVNGEYADRERVLKPDDLVAFFPPVSGGADQSVGDREMTDKKLFEITEQPLSIDDVASRVNRPDCGAIVTFAGTVRGETVAEGKSRETDFLVYEAYEEMAERMLAAIAGEMQARWPQIKAVSIVHRSGRCEVGEPSVVIAVATPHRGDGPFEACRYAIERLKAVAPIWKQENWSDGEVWVEGPRRPELDLSAPDGISPMI